jgi:hypothetical protein
MLKSFILLPMFESGAGQTALHHMEFSSRQACDAAKVTVQAKVKQSRPGRWKAHRSLEADRRDVLGEVT